MAHDGWRCAEHEVLDLVRAERTEKLERAVARMSEAAALAQLSALARTAPAKVWSDHGQRLLDPAARPA